MREVTWITDCLMSRPCDATVLCVRVASGQVGLHTVGLRTPGQEAGISHKNRSLIQEGTDNFISQDAQKDLDVVQCLSVVARSTHTDTH